MRLRAMEVRNWGCIGALSLGELGDGIIVLHGPNRTGKSSLVQAIRSCLFDHFHDSQDKALLAAVPWRTKAAPHVEIEFEQAGQRYRISKTFAKSKEGQASLQQRQGSGWSVLARGKDAAKQVRTLLGVDSSEAGIFQMLWLGQRDFTLPTPRDIDPGLSKALEAVLGTLITGRDIDFKARLDKACERWFTRTMQERKGSPVVELAAKLTSARTEQAEIERQWTDAETALGQYDAALAGQPALQRAVDDALAQLETLQHRCEGVRQRKAQHDLAVKNREQCERLARQAEQRLQDFDDTVRRHEKAGVLLDQFGRDLRGAEETRFQAEQEAADLRLAQENLDAELRRYQDERGLLDDQMRLMANRLEKQTLLARARQVEELVERCSELDEKQTEPPAPSAAQIDALRRNRDRAGTLRARLEAEEIHVVVHARQDLECRITSDGAATQNVRVADAEDRRWWIRQRAEFQIGELATVRVGRGEDDHSLEVMAQELLELDGAWHDAAAAAELDPRDIGALDQLAVLRMQQDEFARNRAELEAELARLAPDGLSALLAQHEQKQAEEEALLTQRPELADDSCDPAQINARRAELDRAESELQSAARKSKQALAQAAAALRQAVDAERSLREQIAAETAHVQTLQQRLDTQDRSALLHELDDANTRRAEAEHNVEQYTLSDAESKLEAQYQTARAAHVVCAERLRRNEIALAELRTKLVGTEGLHQRRIQAEQLVNDWTRDLARESLYAQAHQHLKDLFEEVRQEQVRRTVGPINDRVIAWAKQLGLSE